MDSERYGNLTDEFEQMHSPEAPPKDGAVIACGKYCAVLLDEMRRYLVTVN